jgi:hypothetical protein
LKRRKLSTILCKGITYEKTVMACVEEFGDSTERRNGVIIETVELEDGSESILKYTDSIQLNEHEHCYRSTRCQNTIEVTETTPSNKIMCDNCRNADTWLRKRLANEVKQ